ncbi:MAG: PaaX family transcriptional regulator [Proteobacteria bacterium]|nr:PaaX family transcriptional regulator [Pseudomonadota bacterium]
MRPTAKSLILDLLSTLRRGSMPVRALVSAGTLFGIPDNNLRVALARLLATGTVERDERGRYRLGPAAQAVDQQVVSWRRIEERAGRWRGPCGWLGVHTANLPRARGPERRRRERALLFLGFRELSPGLHVRPDNLTAGASGAREQLAALGLGSPAPLFRLSELDPATDCRARGLWDVAALRAGYRDSLRDIASSEARVPALPIESAMVETFLLGGRVMRQIVLDPLLPEPIAPAAERRALVDAMRAYDRLGRTCWAEFLARHGVPHLRNPVDLRVGEGIRATTTPATGEAA